VPVGGPKHRNPKNTKDNDRKSEAGSPPRGILQNSRMAGWPQRKQILYTTSLIRHDAGTWITPDVEEWITPTWNTWKSLKAELQSHWGVIDAKGEARIKQMRMKQGKLSLTEYRHEFCLLASEAKLEDSTGGELILGGMNTELQTVWGAGSDKNNSREVLA